MVRTKAGQVPPIEPWPVQCQHHDHHANYQIGDALRWQMNTTSRPRPFRLGCLVWATGSRVEYARPSWGCSTRSSSSAHTHTNTTSPFIHALAGQWRPDQTRPSSRDRLFAAPEHPHPIDCAPSFCIRVGTRTHRPCTR